MANKGRLTIGEYINSGAGVKMNKTIDFNQVADIYDDYVNVDFDVPFYINYCKDFHKILELMCGTGRISLPLIRAGYAMTCVDYSENMLKIFRNKLSKGDKVNIVCQDVCDLALNTKFDLIMIPFNSIAEITAAEKRKQALQAIYHHLEQGGTFFCTLYNPQYRLNSADGNLKPLGKFNIAGDKTLVVTFYNSYFPQEQQIRGAQFYEIYDRHNRMIEKRFLDICFSVISKEEILDAACSVGFVLKEIYGDYQQNVFDEKSPFMNTVFVKQ